LKEAFKSKKFLSKSLPNETTLTGTKVSTPLRDTYFYSGISGTTNTNYQSPFLTNGALQEPRINSINNMAPTPAGVDLEIDAEAISNDPASASATIAYQPYHDISPHGGSSPSNTSKTSKSTDQSHSQSTSQGQPQPQIKPQGQAGTGARFTSKQDEEPIQPPKDFNEHFPAHLPVPPFIHVQGVPNFRDLGGYLCPPPAHISSSQTEVGGTSETTGGGGAGGGGGKKYMVRKNLLFRCAHPTQLTQHGATTLRDLGITNIYDLRSAPEIDKLAHSPPSSPSTDSFPGSGGAGGAGAAAGGMKQPPPMDTSPGYITIPQIPRTFTPVYEREDYSPVALARKLKWYTAANSQDKTYSDGFVHAYRDIATHAASGGAYATILRQTIRGLKNMQQNPSLGRRRRPTSAIPNLDFLIQYQQEHEETAEPPPAPEPGIAAATTSTSPINDTFTAQSPISRTSTTSEKPEKKDGGLIFHCTAGKDRTGVLAAVILRLVGVDTDTICWEYAITEPGLGSWRNLFIDRISQGGMGGPNREEQYAREEQQKNHANKNSNETNNKAGTTEAGRERSKSSAMMTRAEAARICGSRAANMRAFLSQVLDGEFGGVEKYLTEMVGLSAEEVEELKRGLVVEVVDEGEVVVCRDIKGWSLEGGMDEDRVYEREELGREGEKSES
jgi:protein tyrosine/serine phosphatase